MTGQTGIRYVVMRGGAGRGAEIVMNWVATIGAKTGRLLPTARPSTPSDCRRRHRPRHAV